MRAYITITFFLLSLGKLYAFLPETDLLTISPAIAKAGSTIEVNLSGTNLEEIRDLYFSDQRIKASPTMYPADDYHPAPRPILNRFKINIPADLPPGIYDVRSLGYFGLSTARPFMVISKDANEILEQGDHSKRESAMPLALETGVAGSMNNKGIDWYKITAKKGQRLLIQLWAERLDSRADGLISVYDTAGRELESNRRHFNKDPFIDFSPAADGEYFIAVSDTLYRGNGHYFYRLKASADPHIDFVFPPAGKAGAKESFTLYGRNLPGASLGENVSLKNKTLGSLETKIDVPATAQVAPEFHPGTPRQALIPTFSYRHGKSNLTRIGFATAPVILEKANIEKQKITLPCEIAGRFDQAGDADTYRFSAKKDDVFWVETISDRIGSTTDTFVIIHKIEKDDKGIEKLTKVIENDDPKSFFAVTQFNDLNADSLDSELEFKAPQDGDYQITIINQLAGGSPAHLYRLALRKPQHDFQLISGHERTKIINNDAFPAAPLLRRNGSLAYRIIALRHDGYAGDITITASGLPQGVTAKPLVLSGESREGFITLKATADAPAWTGAIKLTGSSTIAGKNVTHPAHSASIIWGIRVFAGQRQVRSRLDKEIVLSVTDKELAPAAIEPVENKTWQVELNQKLEIPIKVADTASRKGNLAIEVHGFPGMLRNPPKISIPEKNAEGKIIIDFKPGGNFKIEPGRYQFVLQGIGNTAYHYNPAAVVKAKAEKSRLEALEKKFNAEAASLKKQVAQSQKALAQAKKAATAAADDTARKNLTTISNAAQKKLTALTQQSTAATAKAKKAVQVKTAADKQIKAAENKAKEKNLPFAVYSFPISVEVKAVPKPEKNK